MSIIKNKRIKNFIENNFTSLINLTEVHENDRERTLLTRGLSALSIMAFTSCSKEDAVKSIVDGARDYGIDAIYYDAYAKIVYFIQSKYSENCNKTIDEAAAHKMVYGIQKLLEEKFDGFNQSIISKKDIINKIIDDGSIRIVISPTFNSMNELSESVKKIFTDYIDEINIGDDIMSLRVSDLNHIYTVTSKRNEPINEDLIIKNWSRISNDEENAYLGMIAASDLANLFDKYSDSLFISNIRSFKGETDINNIIVDSINNDPEKFCFLNNGITLIANEIKKKAAGGRAKEVGIFECKGISIVNGAQTVGACHRAFHTNGDIVQSANVIAKIIETKGANNDLSRAITKAANTQNKIERKDFVSLDPYQRDLQEDLDTFGINYIYKTGDVNNSDDSNSYDLTYVTQALIADTNNITLITTAKREIGRIWDDIEKTPYKLIFNPSKNGLYVKNIILLFKEMQNILSEHTKENNRKKQYARYGNVFIASQIFKLIDRRNLGNSNFNFDEALNVVKIKSIQVFDEIYKITENKYPRTPLIYLFRNSTKLKEIENDIII